MDFEIRITETAIAEFEEILAYSWANFPATAERFGKANLNHVDLLKSFPYIGSPIEGRQSVRELIHTPILIFYEVNEPAGIVQILHFWHSSRRSPLAGAQPD